MIDEQAILTAERLRDDLLEFRQRLRSRYPKLSRQVASPDDRKIAAQLAETWLVELATNPDMGAAIGAATLADLNVHFQRMLTFSEHATTRSRYDAELRSLLKDYAVDVILPLKQSRGRIVNSSMSTGIESTSLIRSAFVGQSFSFNDKRINQCVRDTLTALGVKVVTGDEQRLVLVKEQGVVSIGGIQGDYEYIEFSRDQLETLVLRLMQLFDLTNNGLHK